MSAQLLLSVLYSSNSSQGLHMSSSLCVCKQRSRMARFKPLGTTMQWCTGGLSTLFLQFVTRSMHVVKPLCLQATQQNGAPSLDGSLRNPQYHNAVMHRGFECDPQWCLHCRERLVSRTAVRLILRLNERNWWNFSLIIRMSRST